MLFFLMSTHNIKIMKQIKKYLLILELVLMLFDLPMKATEMTDEDAMRCGTAGHELLTQYLRKLNTGATPELTTETLIS